MCGAAASSEATRCEHCGARLATVACPSCFGMMFLGAKFCSHCGAKAERMEVAADKTELCPRCKTDLSAVVIGKNNLRECSRCEGIWVDVHSLNQIYADREEQAAVLGMASVLPTDLTGKLEVVRYLPCPECRELMHRVNFARCSHVIVDVCKPHGTWFDKDELRKIVEFIRAGGLEKARMIEIQELEQQRRALQSEKISGSNYGTGSTWPADSNWPGAKYDGWDIGIAAASSLIKILMR